MATEYENSQKLAAVTEAMEQLFIGDDETDVTYDGETKPSFDKRFAQIVDEYGNIADLTADAEAAAASGEVYASTADALSNGLKTVAITGAGTGGTDNQYIIPVTGSTGENGKLMAVVSGGVLTELSILVPGKNYTGPIVADIDSPTGLTGATASITIGPNRSVGQWFGILSNVDTGEFDRYEVEDGPVATYRRTSAGNQLLDDIITSFAPVNGGYKWLAENASEEVQSFTGTLPKKGGFPSSLGFKGLVAGFEFDDFDFVNKLKFKLDGLDNGDTLRLRLFSRSKASAWHGSPSEAQGDKLLKTVDLTSLPPSASGVRVPIEFDVSTAVTPVNWYLAEVRLLNSDTPVVFGMQSNTTPTGYAQELRGYYFAVAGTWNPLVSANTGIDVDCASIRAASPEFRLNKGEAVTGLIVEGLGNNRPVLVSDDLNGRVKGGRWPASSFDAFGVFRDFSDDEYLHSIVIALDRYQTPETVSVNFKVYAGPVDFDKDDIADAYLVQEITQSVALSDALQDVEFPVGLFVDSAKRYLFVFEGRDEADGVSGLGVAHFDASAESAPMRGVYRSTGSSSWAYPASNGVWAETASYYPYVNKETLGQLLNAFELKYVAVYSRAYSGSAYDTGAAPFEGWAVGYNPKTTRAAKTIAMWLQDATSNTTINFSVIRRPVTAIEASPGVGTDDLVVHTAAYTPAELGITGTETTRVEVDVSSLITFDPDYIYFFKFQGSDGLLGCGKSSADLPAEPYWARGYFTSNGTTYSAIGGTNSLAFEVYENQYLVRERDIAASETIHPSVDTVPVADGLAVTIPASTVVCSGYGAINIDEQTLAITAPASDTSSETVTLKYNTSQSIYTNTNPLLAYRYITGVTVTRDSDDEVLVEGVDYDYFAPGGKVYGLVNTADFAVTIDYTYHYLRYDLIEVNIATGALTVVEGTERTFDPEEYLPVGSAGRLPVAHVFVAGGRTEIIMLSNWQYGIRQFAELEQAGLHKYGRSQLTKSLAKLSNGNPITIAAYGDSITAIQNAEPPYGTPNGIMRDRPDNYFSAMPADTQAAIPLYDFDDGAGEVHCKEGWNWKLVEYYEAHGCDVTYLNYAIGGTNSGAYSNSLNDKGGTNPDRLAALVGSGADLVIVAFGMNEITSSATTANVAAIVAACKAVGMEAIVLGCPRINSYGGRASEQDWARCNQRLWLAAQHAGAAFVSTQFIEESGATGYSGLSAESFCSTNAYNHPGPAQLHTIGRWIVELFKS